MTEEDIGKKILENSDWTELDKKFWNNTPMTKNEWIEYKELERTRTQKKENWTNKEGNQTPNTHLLITNYMENVEKFWKIQPFIYDENKIFWIWDTQKYQWKIDDEVTIMYLIDNQLGFFGQTVTGGIKNNYLEAFKRVGRLHKPKQAKKTWVQFMDQIHDIQTGETFKATPEYFITNPILWDVTEDTQTPILDSLFESWVGSEMKHTLYELIAYCCLPDYPIHILFCLIGGGRNGKTQFQKLITKFLGLHNCSSTELDLLIDNRFETVKLHKKLVCQMGETNFGVMKKTSLLKKLTGGDLIGIEYKNKLPFDTINYAKIIINSNGLPTSADNSEGFYRRWMIIPFPNEFEGGKDIIETIPDSEYGALANKVLKILPTLIENGGFTNQGSVEDRRHKYLLASNPFEIFVNEFCEKDEKYYVKRAELFQAYKTYLRNIKSRIVNRSEFDSALSELGFYAERTTRQVKDLNSLTGNVGVSTWWVDGLKLCKNFSDKIDKMLPFTTDGYIENFDIKSLRLVHKIHKNQDKNLVLTSNDYCSFIDEKGKNGYEKADFTLKYGEQILEKLISDGRIIELPAGKLKTIKQ